MIDKLDLRILRKSAFNPTFQRLYRELMAMEKRPFRSNKLYEYAADLREYGYPVRLSLFSRMDKVGNHKLEIIDVGTMAKSEIFAEIVRVFDVHPQTLGIMRLDFAVDVPGVPLDWFREAVSVSYKRFRSVVTGQPFYSEMGKGEIETLYFGKRPNTIRIYDKRAEYKTQYQTALRKLERNGEKPTFEEMFGFTCPEHPLTRVERQFGGKIPAEIENLGLVCSSSFEFNPFSNLKIIDHALQPERGVGVTFETYCTGMYLRTIAEMEGMQGLKAFIAKESNGNASWAWKKYRSFLPSSTPAIGLSNARLLERFSESFTRQMQA